MDLINTPAFWVNEAGIAFYESGAQNELDVDQAAWEADWLAKHNRDAEGNLILNDTPVHWKEHRVKADDPRLSRETGKPHCGCTNPPHAL